MPFGRHRPGSRSSKLPLRVTSYRPAPDRCAGSPLSDASPLDRAAILAQSKSSHKKASLHAPTAVWTVTAEALHITLPVPPSINHQYATVNGRRLLSTTGRAYKAQVGQQLWVALAQSPARHSLMQRLQSRPLALSIRFFFTSALRRDVDGGLKIAQDALCEGLGLNDNRIVETHLYKDLDKINPRIELSLSALTGPNRAPSGHS